MASSIPNSPWLCPLKPTKTTPSCLYLNPRSSTFKPINSSSSSDNSSEPKKPVLDPVKLAFEKAKSYKNSKTNTNPVVIQGPDGGSDDLVGTNGSREKSESPTVEERANNKKKMTVSSIDFVGLNFSDKRSSRGLPPGLVPTVDPFSDTDEVEIIVGDTSKFEGTTRSNPATVDENQDVYKPKVSTWGVFPRPSNISKTYGGEKVIRPGEALETAEEKASKEARTRQLLAAYKKKVGLNIDPKLKSECQKVLNDGDLLMDRGMLEEALPFYERVMEKLPFQTELHGLAALQWSICQDSLTRVNEARVMYEKLQSHPNPKVSKQARNFVFGFQAMEMLKVRKSTPSPTSTGYQNYFDAFVKDKSTVSLEETEANEGAFSEVLPYMVFLCCPILIVLVIAVQKGI
ncbi:hypothetical protein DCAR_0623826 [Daucus carota subsp. sativus]|uniref:Uncharacterized protein n=1 Tax=Daucus carota subsp. sativus TaxID=79200 RepID=A0AAF1B565_DAUCS|nr:hypothetical protein DCAR_0623826 [Daucus carota subsp. sativus]